MTRRRKIRGTLPPRTGVASVDNELGKGQILFFSENDLYLTDSSVMKVDFAWFCHVTFVPRSFGSEYGLRRGT